MKGAKTANFGAWITRASVFSGGCGFSVGMAFCTCLLDGLWGVHANGGVLIMVGSSHSKV